MNTTSAGEPAGTEPAPLAYSVAEAADLLGGIGRTTLYAEMRAGRIGSVHVGRRRLIRRQDLGAYMALLATEQTGGDAA